MKRKANNKEAITFKRTITFTTKRACATLLTVKPIVLLIQISNLMIIFVSRHKIIRKKTEVLQTCDPQNEHKKNEKASKEKEEYTLTSEGWK